MKECRTSKIFKYPRKSFIDTSGEGNGAIQLRGRKIVIADDSQVGGVTTGQKRGQPLVIKASDSVEVSN
jgi:hypothetical protein